MMIKFTQDHEWIKIQNDSGIVGITDYAQSQLGDIVYVDLPAVGSTVNKGKAVAVVESVKAASDIYSPVTGEIIEINEKLKNTPELVNSSPQETWFFKIKIQHSEELDQLMDELSYNQLLRA
ncbi:MAG: glycine cleavage system protein GcvH [Proteobacteria bacterium]|nr:glycine cleavage system protein GcvH [Pseudomonadota bacterium]